MPTSGPSAGRPNLFPSRNMAAQLLAVLSLSFFGAQDTVDRVAVEPSLPAPEAGSEQELPETRPFLLWDGRTGARLAHREVQIGSLGVDNEDALAELVCTIPKRAVDLAYDAEAVGGLTADASRARILRSNRVQPDFVYTQEATRSDAQGRIRLAHDPLQARLIAKLAAADGASLVGELLEDGSATLWPASELKFVAADSEGRPLSGVLFGLRDARDHRLTRIARSDDRTGAVYFPRHVRLPDALAQEVVCLAPGLGHLAARVNSRAWAGETWTLLGAERWGQNLGSSTAEHFLVHPQGDERAWTPCAAGRQLPDGGWEFVLGPILRSELRVSRVIGSKTIQRAAIANPPVWPRAEIQLSGHVLTTDGSPAGPLAVRVQVAAMDPVGFMGDTNFGCFGIGPPDPLRMPFGSMRMAVSKSSYPLDSAPPRPACANCPSVMRSC